MTCLSISMHISTLFFVIFCFVRPSIANPDSSFSFSFPHFGKDPTKLESQIALYGDSKLVVNGGGFGLIQLTSPGRVVYKKPMKLIEGKPQKLVSFATHFSFSLPPPPPQGELNQGLDFVLLPSDFDLLSKFYNNGSSKDKILTVKFRALDGSSKNNDSFGSGLVKIHAGIDVVGLVSTKVRNFSTVDLTTRNGNKSFAWIDYEASSKRLEVRLSQNGDSKPSDPLFWYPIDLSMLWQKEEALVGFGANSSLPCSIHSWGFELRHVPQWMHSEPLDPNRHSVGGHSKPTKVVEKSKDCVTKILASMIFGVACGALTAFLGLYLWTIFGNKRPVVPEESVDFEYKKFKVYVDKNNDKTIEDGSKQVDV